ncbi:hypothetical protein GCM10028822_20950 [Hymenobacter terrigena]
MDKKRIRGLKRHLRNHQKRATIQEPFNEERMHKLHYDYANLGLAPWRVNGKPPVAIRKLWVSQLVANYKEWHKQIVTRYDDFYLAVWIYDPTFGESQVVAAIQERMDGYAEMHGEILDLPLPVEYRSLPGINDLQWTAREYLTVDYPEYFAQLGAWGRRKPHWPVVDSNGDTLIIIQLGVVWVGQIAP